MKDTIITMIVLIGILAAFAVVGTIDFDDAVAQQSPTYTVKGINHEY